MNDHEIDRLLKQIEFDGGDRLEGMLREAGQELLEEIMSKPVVQKHDVDAVEIPVVALKPRRKPARWLLGAAAAVAAVVAVALPMAVFDREEESAVVPAAGSVNSAGNPFLVLDDPDWEPSSLGQSELEGFQDFLGPKGSALIVHWGKAERYPELYEAQRDGFDPSSELSSMELLGAEAAVFKRHDGNFMAMLPPGSSPVYLDFFATDMKSLDEFTQVLSQLRPVSEQEWTEALPSDTIFPDEAVAAARQMLSEVPVPDGVEAGDFPAAFTTGYYQYASPVADALFCGWVRQFQDARSSGDEARLDEAGEALAGSRTWPVLMKMRAIEKADPQGAGEGELVDKYWQVGDAAAAGESLSGPLNEFGGCG
ncbi:hypothetical protein [Kineosporia babensis]|uniref:Uncharacterized protein n=1 Tax=Kineosporia babensis TaxID=499548 RepID=A0A9X1SWE8_9ACTN|nr:hypothetical protein [Kineosporia babensis]MCD5309448.1 hypothetical protein [Kineosporia babensis]